MKWLSKKYQLTQPILQEEDSIYKTRLNALIQKTNQKVLKNIEYGKAYFSQNVDLKKKQKPFSLDMNRFKGSQQEYKTISRIATSIQNSSQFYSERVKTQQKIKAKISFIDKNIRNIRQSIEQQKVFLQQFQKLKRALQKQKQKQAKFFIKNIKNPQVIQSNYNFKKILKNKSKSEGILKLQNKNQSNKPSRIKTERAFSNQKSKKLTLVLKSNIQERSQYIDKIRAIFNSKEILLPSIYKQKLKPLSGISKNMSSSSPLKMKKKQRNNVDQVMDQIIFKKLNKNSQILIPKSPKKTKQKYQRVQDGNKMLKQSLKRIKTKQQIQISQEKQRIIAYKQNLKKSKIIGDQYLKESLLQIRLPLQKFIEQRHLQSLQMQNYIKIARQQKKKQEQQKWTRLMDKIANKQINKYQGLIKIGSIQRKLQKLGDDPDNRLLLKCLILKQNNIQ